jgi:hypothetical protein
MPLNTIIYPPISNNSKSTAFLRVRKQGLWAFREEEWIKQQRNQLAFLWSYSK